MSADPTLEFLTSELSSEDPSKCVECISRLQVVALSLGAEKTVSLLIPYLAAQTENVRRRLELPPKITRSSAARRARTAAAGTSTVTDGPADHPPTRRAPAMPGVTGAHLRRPSSARWQTPLATRRGSSSTRQSAAAADGRSRVIDRQNAFLEQLSTLHRYPGGVVSRGLRGGSTGSRGSGTARLAWIG